MIQLKFTRKSIDKLFNEFENNEHNRVRKKMLAIYLKSLEFKHKDIERVCRISRPTLACYLKNYKEKGIENFKKINFYQPESDLKDHEETLKKYFEEYPPSSSNDAKEKIKELTNIERSPTQIRNFMKKIGVKFAK